MTQTEITCKVITAAKDVYSEKLLPLNFVDVKNIITLAYPNV